jgi:hypothetical protein
MIIVCKRADSNLIAGSFNQPVTCCRPDSVSARGKKEGRGRVSAHAGNDRYRVACGATAQAQRMSDDVIKGWPRIAGFTAIPAEPQPIPRSDLTENTAPRTQGRGVRAASTATLRSPTVPFSVAATPSTCGHRRNREQSLIVKTRRLRPKRIEGKRRGSKMCFRCTKTAAASAAILSGLRT